MALPIQKVTQALNPRKETTCKHGITRSLASTATMQIFAAFDIESDGIKLVARALLPAEINVGSKLKYEMFQYEVIE